MYSHACVSLHVYLCMCVRRYAREPLELFWERDRNDEFDDSAYVR